MKSDGVFIPEKNSFLSDELHNSFYGIPLKKVLGLVINLMILYFSGNPH